MVAVRPQVFSSGEHHWLEVGRMGITALLSYFLESVLTLVCPVSSSPSRLSALQNSSEPRCDIRSFIADSKALPWRTSSSHGPCTRPLCRGQQTLAQAHGCSQMLWLITHSRQGWERFCSNSFWAFYLQLPPNCAGLNSTARSLSHTLIVILGLSLNGESQRFKIQTGSNELQLTLICGHSIFVLCI